QRLGIANSSSRLTHYWRSSLDGSSFLHRKFMKSLTGKAAGSSRKKRSGASRRRPTSAVPRKGKFDGCLAVVFLADGAGACRQPLKALTALGYDRAILVA